MKTGIDICFFDRDPNKEIQIGSTVVDGLASTVAKIEQDVGDNLIDNWKSEFASAGIACMHQEHSTTGDDNWHYSLYQTEESLPEIPDIYEFFFGKAFPNEGLPLFKTDFLFDDQGNALTNNDEPHATNMANFFNSEYGKLLRNFHALLDPAVYGQFTGNNDFDWMSNYSSNQIQDQFIQARATLRKQNFIKPVDNSDQGTGLFPFTLPGPGLVTFGFMSIFTVFEIWEWNDASESFTVFGPYTIDPNEQNPEYSTTPSVSLGISDEAGLFELLFQPGYALSKYNDFIGDIVQNQLDIIHTDTGHILITEENGEIDENRGNFVSLPIVSSREAVEDLSPSFVPINGYTKFWDKFTKKSHFRKISESEDFTEFFDNVVDVEKFYDVFFSYSIIMASRDIPNIENIFQTTKDELKRTFQSLIKPFNNFDYRDGDVMEKGGTLGMYQTANTVSSTSPDFAAIAAKFAAMAPFMIIKGLAETFDPNIKIAKFIRLGALAAGVDIPMPAASLAALPMNVIPFAPGPPIGPLGLAYLASGFLEPKERERLSEIAEGVNNAASVGSEDATVIEPATPLNEDGSDSNEATPDIEIIQILEPESAELEILRRVLVDVWNSISGSLVIQSRIFSSDGANFDPWEGFSADIDQMMGDSSVEEPYSIAAAFEEYIAFVDGQSGFESQFFSSALWDQFPAQQGRALAAIIVWKTYASLWQFYWKLLFLYKTAKLPESTVEDVIRSQSLPNDGAGLAPFCFRFHDALTYDEIMDLMDFVDIGLANRPIDDIMDVIDFLTTEDVINQLTKNVIQFYFSKYGPPPLDFNQFLSNTNSDIRKALRDDFNGLESLLNGFGVTITYTANDPDVTVQTDFVEKELRFSEIWPIPIEDLF